MESLRLDERIYFTRATHDSIMDIDNLVALECPICVDFREGKTGVPGESPRSTAGKINFRVVNRL